jgi:hypothetical protein
MLILTDIANLLGFEVVCATGEIDRSNDRFKISIQEEGTIFEGAVNVLKLMSFEIKINLLKNYFRDEVLSLSQLLETGNSFTNSLKKTKIHSHITNIILIYQRYQNKQTFFPCSNTYLD